MNNSLSKPTILFTSPILHHPPLGGPTLRIENSIKALSKISNLYVYSRVNRKLMGGKKALKFYESFCNKVFLPPFISLNIQVLYLSKKIINKINRFLFKENLFEIIQQEPEQNYQKLLDIADQIKADIIWLGYGNISYPLLKYLKSNSAYKVVLDTDSVWSRFILRELPYTRDKKRYKEIYQIGQKKIEEENWGTKLADATTAVSEIDAEYYRNLAEHANQVHLFSNVIDLEHYQNSPPLLPNFQKPCIYLAGTFGINSPMEDAARWTIKEVLPIIRQKIPKIHFYIIGNGSKKTLSDIQDPNITITGQLESVLPYLCHADVAIVPLRFESGTRFKILEAGACKIPVVSTTLGAEGIPVTHDHNILLADEPTDFSNAIIKLIQDSLLAKRIANNLFCLIQNSYSISSLTQQGLSILKFLIENKTFDS